MNDCVFCKIVRGEIPSYKIYEDEKFLVFLDAFPTMEGQVLVIPKEHSSDFFELPSEDRYEIIEVAQKIANAMKKVFHPVKVGLIVEGLQINHIHVKLYPLDENGFCFEQVEVSEVRMKKIVDELKSFLE